MKTISGIVILVSILATACAPATPTPATTGPVIQTLIIPPYDDCIAKASPAISQAPAGIDLLLKGFSNVSSSCDAKRGVINYSMVLFGGKNGNIFDPPSQEATALGDIIIKYTSPFTGDLKVDATLAVNSKTGVAAGSATALPDFEGFIADFIPIDKLSNFLTLAKGFIFGTFVGMETYADLSVNTGTLKKSALAVKVGQNIGASFPFGQWSTNLTYDREPVVISLTVPVTQGQTILITTGISTNSKVYGWASAYWNPRRSQETFVRSISLTRPYVPGNSTTPPSRPPTITPAPALIPSFTPTPTNAGSQQQGNISFITPTIPPSVASLRGAVNQRANCRYGPGAPYTYKYGVKPGTQMEVIGRDADGNWLQVQGLGGHNPCWIKADLIDVIGDLMSLPDAYPQNSGLPISPFFPQISISSSSSGGIVTVEWPAHAIRSDLNTEEGIEYIVEVWTCVDGKPNFTPIGIGVNDDTSASFQVDSSCGFASHADLIGEDKEGFSPPTMIPVP